MNLPPYIAKANLVMGGTLIGMGISKFLGYPERGLSWWLLLGMGVLIVLSGWFWRPR
jgi:hypothetical protein